MSNLDLNALDLARQEVGASAYRLGIGILLVRELRSNAASRSPAIRYVCAADYKGDDAIGETYIRGVGPTPTAAVRAWVRRIDRGIVKAPGGGLQVGRQVVRAAPFRTPTQCRRLARAIAIEAGDAWRAGVLGLHPAR